jgi:hypothetical protein
MSNNKIEIAMEISMLAKDLKNRKNKKDQDLILIAECEDSAALLRQTEQRLVSILKKLKNRKGSE